MPNIENDIVAIQTATNAKSMREPIAEALELLHREVVELPIDDEPVEGSTALVKSGGVYSLWDTVTDGQDLYYPSDETIQHEKIINEAGEYIALDDGYDGYTKVIVDPSIEAQPLNLLSKHITYPGIYYASDDNCDGYRSVEVDLVHDEVVNDIVGDHIISTASIPEFDMITSVCSYGFYSRQALKNVSMTNCVELGECAFANCKMLETVELPSCRTIESGTFSNCEVLSTVSLYSVLANTGDFISQHAEDEAYQIRRAWPSSVPDYAFYNCTSLSSFYLDFRRNIGSYAFANCQNLVFHTLTTYGSIDNAIVDDRNMILMSPIGEYAFANCSKLNLELDVVAQRFNDDIPQPLSLYELSSEYLVDLYIGKSAFKNCINLPKVYINPGFSEEACIMIGSHAFEECNNLQAFTVASNLSSSADGFTYFAHASRVIIKECAFKSCYHLSSMRVYATEIILGSYAFEDCYNLGLDPFNSTVIIAPQMGEGVYKNCSTISAISFIRYSEPKYNIPKYTFEHCVGLASIYLANYNIHTNAFLDCINLESIKLDACNISSYAFEGCSKLTTITFGSSITGNIVLSDYAFAKCVSLHEIHVKRTIEVPDINNVFESTPFAGYSEYCQENPVIYFAAQDTMESYMSAPGWASLASYMMLE